MSYTVLPRNKYFEVVGGLNVENMTDNKVGMASLVDVSGIERVRAEHARRGEPKPSYTAFVVAAVSAALREHPHANTIPIEVPFRRRLVRLDRVDITVAVERDRPGTEQAVYAGTIRDADTLGLGEITGELRALANVEGEAGKRWELFRRIVENVPAGLARMLLMAPRRSADLWVKHRGGAVMISSPAKYGVDLMMGHWPWPLGFSFGIVEKRPVVVGDQVVARPTMWFTMSFDRRIMGGAPAARFFRTVTGRLEGQSGNVVRPASPSGARAVVAAVP